MNIVYTILESRYRWLILAGISFVAGTFGGMFMLAYVWPHWLIRIWLLAGLILTFYFGLRAAFSYFRSLELVDDAGARRANEDVSTDA